MSAPRDEGLYESLRRLILEEVAETEAAEPAAGASPAGRRFGRYLLIEEIGEGASSVVHRAVHVDLEKTLAVKIMKRRAASGGAEWERFRREALTVARLEHPGIVAVHDVGVVGDEPYLAMELVEGPTLSEWIAEAAPDLDERLRVIEEAAHAVAEAHRAGVIHRDLKPDNLLIDRAAGDRAVIVDFGLARAAEDPRVTRDGTPVGTPMFMAPEQVRGERGAVGPATDVHALGVMLYEVATGALPYEADDLETLFTAIETETPRSPRAQRPELPADLDAVVWRCLEKDPRDRYSDAAGLAADLAALRRGDPVSVRPLGATTRALRRMKRHPVRLLVVLVVLGLLALGGGLAREAWRTHRTVRRALAVESSVGVAASRLRGVLVRAENARGRGAAARAGLAEEGRRILNGLDDDTGVAAAYALLLDHLLGEGEFEARLAAARAAHPDDPLVPLFGARVRLRQYLEQVTWPSISIPLHPTERRPRMPVIEETETMKAWREHAATLVAAARATPLWPHLSTRWIEELRAGIDAYARDDLATCIARLTPLMDRADAEVSVHQLVALAHFREGRLDDCLATSRALVTRRPEDLGGRRWLLAGLIVAIEQRLAASEEVEALLGEATQQLAALPPNAFAAERAELDLLVGLVSERRGVSPVAALERAVAGFRPLRFAKDAPLPVFMGLAMALQQLSRHRPGQRALLEEALGALTRAEAMAPNDHHVLFNRLVLHLDLLKRRARKTPIPETTWGAIARDVARCRDLGASALEATYLEVFAAFCRAQVARARDGEDPELHTRALQEIEAFLERWPHISEVRQLALVTRCHLAEGEPEPLADDLLELAEEVRSLTGAHPRYGFLRDHLPRLLDRTRLRLMKRARQRRPETLEGPRRLTFEAIAEWEAARSRRPDDPEPSQRLAEAQQDLRRLDPERSRHWIAVALETSEGSRRRWPRRVLLHVQAAQLALMLAEHPDTPETERSPLRDRARAATDQALGLAPDDPTARALRARLATR